MAHEKIEVDILIVGAGPAGLAAAIRLAQQRANNPSPLEIAVLEKGSQVGSHILSGAVLEPSALSELIPDWQIKKAPVQTQVTKDQLLYLTKNKSWQLPTPKTMRNDGNYIISLGLLCRWLGNQAETLGIQIFTGFAGTRILYENGKVIGIATGDMGLDKSGQKTERFQAGVEIQAKYILLAEGCRGSLTKEIIHTYRLDRDAQPQSYGIGVKELWQVSNKYYQPGLVIHTIGWPLDAKTYGGSFLYHREDNKIAVGFVVGLDYKNPYLDPFLELQRFKTHPTISKYFEEGKRIGYGAKALVEGGYQSIPKLSFPGGLIIGDAAGLLNVAKIKGIHNAMRSGILAADFILNEMGLTTQENPQQFQPNKDLPLKPAKTRGVFLNRKEVTSTERENLTLAQKSLENHTKQNDFTQQIKNASIGKELHQTRNIRPAFQWGLWPALIYNAIDNYLFSGHVPWTLHFKRSDHKCLKPASKCKPIDYPKSDDKLTFDKLSSVYLTNVNHEENQPCHLQLINQNLAISVNYKIYDSPETRYCPAKVYEIIKINDKIRLQINAANCIHCKTCDIKDPKQNINWVPPQGGEGPNYTEL